MLNKNGGKLRLTFKLELDQLWIGTKDRTEKISMNSIKTIVSEPIEGHEEYHIMVRAVQQIIPFFELTNNIKFFLALLVD